MKRRAADWAVPLLVAAVTFVAFLPALRAGFVDWDDDSNFVDNLHYRGLGWPQLQWMWTTFLLGHYVPLSWMTLGLDYAVWGMNPAGYHLTNLLLHTANAVLLYFVARRLLRLTGVVRESDWMSLAIPAAFAALLFAVHPMRVESVVWITERRDVLSGFFYLLSILFYLRDRDHDRTSRASYWLAIAMFICALLSKGTAVTLPAVLLILNVYPLARLGRTAGWWNASARLVYRELLPFVLFAAAAVVMTFVALQSVDQLSLAGKVAVSAYSLAFYLWKTVAPLRLSPLYKMPTHVDPAAAVYILSYAVVIGFVGLAWMLRRRRPGVTIACLVFVVVLLPLLGIHQNGPQIAADRYTYGAAPALAILAAAGLASLSRPLSAGLAVVASGTILVLGALTWHQTLIWHDSERLWSHVLSLDDESPVALAAVANLLAKQGKTDEAIQYYDRSLALDPRAPEPHNNLGTALSRKRRFAEAVDQFQRAVAIKPAYYEAQNNWGLALAEQGGDMGQSIEHYRAALAINPDYADAHVNWGNALVQSGNFEGAIAHYQEAFRIRPDDADAQRNWGVALARQGKLTEAIDHFRQAIVLRPDFTEAQELLERATQLQRQRQATGRSK